MFPELPDFLGLRQFDKWPRNNEFQRVPAGDLGGQQASSGSTSVTRHLVTLSYGRLLYGRVEYWCGAAQYCTVERVPQRVTIRK